MENEEVFARILALEAFAKAVRNGLPPSLQDAVGSEFRDAIAAVQQALAESPHSESLRQSFATSADALFEYQPIPKNHPDEG